MGGKCHKIKHKGALYFRVYHIGDICNLPYI